MSETPKIPDWKNARSMDQPHFAFWMSSLTSEGLHAKADIARLLAMLTQALSAAEKLLPCPFCGSEAVAYFDGEDCIAVCNDPACDHMPCIVGNATIAEATTKWNRRTPSSPMSAQSAYEDCIAALSGLQINLTDVPEYAAEYAARVAKATLLGRINEIRQRAASLGDANG